MSSKHKNGCVYIITNTRTSKVYIGQTIKSNREERWRQHKNAAKRGATSKLYNAIRKYGIDSFSFKILIDNIPLSVLDVIETAAITTYDSCNKGYNIVPAGQSMRGYKFSEETLQHLSRVRKGKIPYNKGKKYPELSGCNHPRARAVFCINNQKYYISCLEAAKELNLHHSSVVAVCKGRINHTNNYVFEYVIDGTIQLTERINKTKGKYNVNAKRILCINTNQEFESISEAASALKLKAASISSVLKNQRNSLFGYTFKYL